MTEHTDDFQLALEYAPPGYPSIDATAHGRWVQLRRWGAGVVLATDEVGAVSVCLGDEQLNPGSGDFGGDLMKILRVLCTAGHRASDAYDILRRHPEFPVRGPEHRGRLSAARVLSQCIAFDPSRVQSLWATFDCDTDVFAEVVLSAYWGYSIRRDGWRELSESETEELFDRVHLIDISAHGVAFIEELLSRGSIPSVEEMRYFEGAADDPLPSALPERARNMRRRVSLAERMQWGPDDVLVIRRGRRPDPETDADRSGTRRAR